MTEDEERAQFQGMVVMLGACVGGAIYYGIVLRRERKKRKKIQEWSDMNLSAIAASKKRLMDVLNDPTHTWNEFVMAYREESEFISLIKNQPMY